VKLSGAYSNSKLGPPSYPGSNGYRACLRSGGTEASCLGAVAGPHPNVPNNHKPDDAVCLTSLLHWAPREATRHRILFGRNQSPRTDEPPHNSISGPNSYDAKLQSPGADPCLQRITNPFNSCRWGLFFIESAGPRLCITTRCTFSRRLRASSSLFRPVYTYRAEVVFLQHAACSSSVPFFHVSGCIDGGKRCCSPIHLTGKSNRALGIQALTTATGTKPRC
jgi:hypothetical protein